MMNGEKKTTLLAQGGQGRNNDAGSDFVSMSKDSIGYRDSQPIHGRVTNGVWHKTLQRSKHMLHKPPAWAVDLSDLERAERCGVVALELYETEQGVTYYATLDTWRKHGRLFNRGYGQQVMLALGYWQTGAPVAPPPPDQPRQLALL